RPREACRATRSTTSTASSTNVLRAAAERTTSRLAVAAAPYNADELRKIAHDRDKGAAVNAIGIPAREWNAHPPQSPVLARSCRLTDVFVVIDLPPVAALARHPLQQRLGHGLRIPARAQPGG